MQSRIIGYHHVTRNIARADLDKVRFFYTALLGLEEISAAQQDPTGQRLLWFTLGKNQLHLVIGDEPDPPSNRHIAVLVADFDGLVADLHRNGVRFEESEPGQIWRLRNGLKFAFCYDPCGNRIEFLENPR